MGIDEVASLAIAAAGPDAETMRSTFSRTRSAARLGVIASLDRPGGNVTGVTHFTPELMAKRVQLLKELLPSASRFAVLRLPGRLQDLVVKDAKAIGRSASDLARLSSIPRDQAARFCIRSA